MTAAPDRPLSAERRAEIAAMLAAITPGTWHWEDSYRLVSDIAVKANGWFDTHDVSADGNNRVLITAAPTLVAELLAAHDAAVARADAAERIIALTRKLTTARAAMPGAETRRAYDTAHGDAEDAIRAIAAAVADYDSRT